VHPERAALPDLTSWPSFPFEGPIRVRHLDDPVVPEPARIGEDPDRCMTCLAPDEHCVWVSDRWRVRALDRPSGLPVVVVLETRSHLDLGDLPNLLAAELGVMTVRLERAIRSIDGVARVQVNRWGDDSAHLQVWFFARPYGRVQLRGPFLSVWDEILPPVPEADWRANLAMVAAWLAEYGGRSYAEPAQIQWGAMSLDREDDAGAPTAAADAEPADGSPAPGEATARLDARPAPDQTDPQDAGKKRLS
jgi:hypothetical protein